MVRKFSFCSNFYVDVSQTVKHLLLTQFYRFENSLYFIKHDPEVIIFYSDRNFYISQEISHNACRC